MMPRRSWTMGEKEADEKLADAKEELDKGEKDLEDGRKEYEDGKIPVRRRQNRACRWEKTAGRCEDRAC